MNLLKNIRIYVYLLTMLLSVCMLAYAKIFIPETRLQIIRLTQTSALLSVVYLYFALLAGPLCYTFRSLPFRGIYLKTRRAIGVSAFYFGCVHGIIAFFLQLDGFAGLAYLTNKYLFAILLSFAALMILSLMAATSFDFMVTKLTYKRWKFIHRFVYLAGIFILIHGLLLGTHFQNVSGIIPKVSLVALLFLFALEGLRIVNFINKLLSKSQ